MITYLTFQWIDFQTLQMPKPDLRFLFFLSPLWIICFLLSQAKGIYCVVSVLSFTVFSPSFHSLSLQPSIYSFKTLLSYRIREDWIVVKVSYRSFISPSLNSFSSSIDYCCFSSCRALFTQVQPFVFYLLFTSFPSLSSLSHDICPSQSRPFHLSFDGLPPPSLSALFSLSTVPAPMTHSFHSNFQFKWSLQSLFHSFPSFDHLISSWLLTYSSLLLSVILSTDSPPHSTLVIK